MNVINYDYNNLKSISSNVIIASDNGIVQLVIPQSIRNGIGGVMYSAQTSNTSSKFSLCRKLLPAAIMKAK